jgi:hypothetical protein
LVAQITLVNLGLPKKSEEFFPYTVIVLIFSLLILGFLSSLIPTINVSEAQDIQKSVITLDGVLFGFTGVMVGLFTRNIKTLSEKTLKRIFFFALLAFFSFIFSMIFSFIQLGLGTGAWGLTPFAPMFMMIYGAFCSSVYLLQVFYEDVFPPQNESKS